MKHPTTMLGIFKAARKLLEKGYIKWRERDGKGGYCAVGAIREVTADWNLSATAFYLSNEKCKALYPHLAGKSARRLERFGGTESFDVKPTVFVNNHGTGRLGGKRAILKAWDSIIADLQQKPEVRK